MAVLIRKSLSELVDQIIGLCTKTMHKMYPTEFQTYDEAWDNLSQSLTYLRDKLGEQRYSQLVDMAAQAKEHFEAGHAPGGDDWQITLGARLTQDMERVVKGKAPFAYPEELYRWPRSPGEYGTRQSIQ